MFTKRFSPSLFAEAERPLGYNIRCFEHLLPRGYRRWDTVVEGERAMARRERRLY